MILFVLTMSSLLMGPQFASAVEKCLEPCQHQKALKDLSEQILDHSNHGPQDEGCPAAGHKTVEMKESLEGRLLSARQLLEQINQSLSKNADPLQKDQTLCGASCKQSNAVTNVSISRPLTQGSDAACAARPSESVRGDFSDVNEAAAYVQTTLDGKNSDGARLYTACPDPCSFYVYNAQTTLPNGKIRLNMLVRCGQPRGGFFSKYVFSGALVHEWTCQKR